MLISQIQFFFSAITKSESEAFAKDKEEPSFVIVGKPNSGKSTLYNFLLKKDVSLVSPVPGTTRDSLESKFSLYRQDFRITDTAGLRKNRASLQKVDELAEQKSIHSIRQANLVILLIEPYEGFDRQNKNMIRLIHKLKKPTVVAVNKADVIRQNKELRENLHKEALALQNIFWQFPLYFISSKDGSQVMKLIKSCCELYEKASIRYLTAKVNKFFTKH